ncbi:carbohydrate ABC transporter permease [Pseudonocardiaceae bacterium YIM PH 21723]|nr:carbohydrate ABC transporter permease [Pseudonocardiaceae bacterium YIM PH 21723]
MTKLFSTKGVGLSAISLLVGALFIFPFYWMASTALKPNADVLSNDYDLLPARITVANFGDAIDRPFFLSSLTNGLIVSLTAVGAAVLAALLSAIPLSRLKFRGRKGFLLLVMISQLAPLEALFIPLFLIMNDLDLLNTLFSMILVYFGAVLPFSVWTLRGFVSGIPVELEEAAMVDGCTRWGAFRRVTLPLLGPGLVATSVFGFITAWNEFLYALVFTSADANLQTLPVWLNGFTGNQATEWGTAMAASVIFTVPVLIFFLIVQRNLVAGVTAGAVKG